MKTLRTMTSKKRPVHQWIRSKPSPSLGEHCTTVASGTRSIATRKTVVSGKLYVQFPLTPAMLLSLTIAQVPPLTHFHPSVSLLATSLFSDDKQMAKPDLESHSLIRFLDKFVYRSPKVAEAARGASIMQPVRNPDSGSIWLAKRTGSAAAAPINTPNFWNKKIEQVAAEDIFFHEYFKQAGKKNEAGKKEAKPLASVPDEPEDDAEEDEIWKALTASHPDGPIDSDESDLDMDGFDDSDDDSDGGVVFSDGSGAELSDGGELNEDIEGFEDEEDDDDDSDEMGHGGEASELAALPEETKEASEKSKRAGRSSKRKLKDLPMFASADDYAELLAQEEDI